MAQLHQFIIFCTILFAASKPIHVAGSMRRRKHIAVNTERRVTRGSERSSREFLGTIDPVDVGVFTRILALSMSMPHEDFTPSPTSAPATGPIAFPTEYAPSASAPTIGHIPTEYVPSSSAPTTGPIAVPTRVDGVPTDVDSGIFSTPSGRPSSVPSAFIDTLDEKLSVNNTSIATTCEITMDILIRLRRKADGSQVGKSSVVISLRSALRKGLRTTPDSDASLESVRLPNCEKPHKGYWNCTAKVEAWKGDFSKDDLKDKLESELQDNDDDNVGEVNVKTFEITRTRVECSKTNAGTSCSPVDPTDDDSTDDKPAWYWTYLVPVITCIGGGLITWFVRPPKDILANAKNSNNKNKEKYDKIMEFYSDATKIPPDSLEELKIFKQHNWQHMQNEIWLCTTIWTQKGFTKVTAAVEHDVPVELQIKLNTIENEYKGGPVGASSN